MQKSIINQSKKQKHTLTWFSNRIGSYVIKNSKNNLFEPPILIESQQHAKALYLTQVANHTYTI